MNRISWLNLAAYAGALILAAAGVLLAMPGQQAGRASAAASGSLPGDRLADGRPAVRDARGTLVAIGGYRRIAALDLVADELVGQLVEPARIAAVSRWTQGPEAWRLAGLPRLPGLDDLEAVLAVKPDLVLISTFGGESDRVQRLRDAGIAVCDLGPAGGVASLCANLRRVAALTGSPERGERLAAAFTRRLAAVAAHLPSDHPPRRALVLTPVVDQVYGGTTGSSFHDILTAAGLADAAAGRFAEPWPRIGAEQALALDPDLVVVRAGALAELRRIPGFGRLRALCSPDGVVELPEALFDGPGLSMLDAAERLCDLAHPGIRR